MLSIKNSLGGGNSVLIDGEPPESDRQFQSVDVFDAMTWITTGLAQGSAVKFNGCVYVFGGYYSTSSKTQYQKYDGGTWTVFYTLPYSFVRGSAVVLNGEVHLLGSTNTDNSTNASEHYKWDGTTWTKVGTLPYSFGAGDAVVYNDEIHIFGSSLSTSYNKYHYKFNGTKWTKVSNIPFPFVNGSAVIYNNEIHLLGTSNTDSSANPKKHYKFNGTSWESASTLPYSLISGNAATQNNYIRILGGTDNELNNYIWDGAVWTQRRNLPYCAPAPRQVFSDNDEIWVIGGTTVSGKPYCGSAGCYKLSIVYKPVI